MKRKDATVTENKPYYSKHTGLIRPSPIITLALSLEYVKVVRAHLLIRSRTARVQGLESEVTSSGDHNRAGGIHHPEGSQHREGGSRVEEGGRRVLVHSCTGREVDSHAGRGRRSGLEVAGSRPRAHGEEATGTLSDPRSNRGAGFCRGSRHGTHLGVGSSQQVVDHVGPSHRAEGRDDGRLGSEIGHGRPVVACRAGSVLVEY